MRALGLLLLVACRQGAPEAPSISTAAPRTEPEPAPAPAPGPRTGPPRGPIAMIAVTDEGDAALTADGLGGLRLWPSLDGTRPPVILPPGMARQLALAHDRAGFVAGVLDEAGHVSVVRMAGDGRVIERVQLADDPGYAEIVAVRDGLLVLGRDQIVSRVDAQGRQVARLAPRPAEHIVELAARKGEAIAGIGDAGAATSVRRLVLDGDLAWGPAIELARPLAQLALSPDHRRIAGVVAGRGEGEVIELASARHVVASGLSIDSPFSASHEPSTIGFVDGTHVAMAGDFELRWAGTRPDKAVTFGAGANSAQAVFGDNVVVVGRADALAPVRWQQPVRYLGYHAVGVGSLATAGRHVAMGLGFGILWFDGRLGVTRVMEETGHQSGVSSQVLDDHLVVEVTSSPVRNEPGAPRGDDLFEAPAQAAREPTRFVVRDVQRGTVHAVGAWRDSHVFAFDPASRVLAIASGQALERFAIDDRGAVTRLDALALQVDPETIAPIDPRLADGIVAIAVARDQGHLLIDTLREADAATVRVAAIRLLGIDRRGTAWILRGDHEVIAYRDGVRVHRFSVAVPVDEGSVSHDGSFVVLYQWQQNTLIAVDAAGRERWRRSLIQIETAKLTGDDRGVAVGTNGALRLLDAATGDVQASGCAWQFGLHDAPSLSNATQCDESE